MRQFAPRKDLVFSPFTESLANYSLPEKFTFPFEYEPHPLVILAVKKLQQHLTSQQEWNHNFGLSEEEGVIIGKMFGVLLVRTEDNEIGYLAAFSGKLAGGNHHPGFVPPIFDGMENGGFLNAGMVELSRINHEISILEKEKTDTYQKQVQILKTQRKNHSVSLQNKIFDQYNFLNQNGEEKSLRMIFEQASYKNPPAGAGECAAPKLLQYAFQHHMEPLAMAEFWWGLSPKSENWKHGHFYPSCQEKCAPILAHMLAGIEMDTKPE
ncbi:pseudouridylate synthase [Dyadobacter sp. NIV53]|uniref:pseudouridylate synthase n=1 Tax=Dyadobacter sp. NIV53 TaxID=2861765 RepID=UPI001E5F249D|nr:pseudouridylate synthase [Dyadobacter sp. NIV53]